MNMIQSINIGILSNSSIILYFIYNGILIQDDLEKKYYTHYNMENNTNY